MDLGSIIKGLGKPKKGATVAVEVTEPTVTDEEGAAAVAELKDALKGDDDVLTWQKFIALTHLAEKCEPGEMDMPEEEVKPE